MHALAPVHVVTRPGLKRASDYRQPSIEDGDNGVKR